MANSKASRITYPDTLVNGYRIDPLGGRTWNGGWTLKGKRAYRQACITLTHCLLTYKRPQLFHLCFYGSTAKKHQTFVLFVAKYLRKEKRIPCQWFGSLEIDDRKGEHIHAYFVVDNGYEGWANDALNTFEGGYLVTEAAKRDIKMYVNKPQDPMHKGKWFVELPWLGSSKPTSPEAMARLEDALVWMTYPFKGRDKPENAKAGQTFPSSRPSRKHGYKPEHSIPVQHHPRFLSPTRHQAELPASRLH